VHYHVNTDKRVCIVYTQFVRSRSGTHLYYYTRSRCRTYVLRRETVYSFTLLTTPFASSHHSLYPAYSTLRNPLSTLPSPTLPKPYSSLPYSTPAYTLPYLYYTYAHSPHHIILYILYTYHTLSNLYIQPYPAYTQP